MQKPRLLVFVIALCTSAATPVYATSGGLNKCGCHNSKTAGYHCHKDLCPADKSTAPQSSAPPKPAPRPASSAAKGTQ